MIDERDQNESQRMDVFKEIGNIGAGNAATAMASVLNTEIRMETPTVQFVPFNDIVNILNGPETLVVGLLVGMSGDLNGSIMLVLEMGDAYEMARTATGQRNGPPFDPRNPALSALEQSALEELANIIVGTYLSAICTMTGLTVRPAVPQMAIDMVGAIMSIVAIEYGKIGDSVLFLKTRFTDVNKAMTGHFFLIPDFDSYHVLIRSLRLD
ncbi:MAG: CheY-P-specific phosphatase CheC [Clostridiales bacterium]|nr:CheY-P-specific phosphatase CheC [Clostridiales bacterium]